MPLIRCRATLGLLVGYLLFAALVFVAAPWQWVVLSGALVLLAALCFDMIAARSEDNDNLIARLRALNRSDRENA